MITKTRILLAAVVVLTGATIFSLLQLRDARKQIRVANSEYSSLEEQMYFVTGECEKQLDACTEENVSLAAKASVKSVPVVPPQPQISVSVLNELRKECTSEMEQYVQLTMDSILRSCKNDLECTSERIETLEIKGILPLKPEARDAHVKKCIERKQTLLK